MLKIGRIISSQCEWNLRSEEESSGIISDGRENKEGPVHKEPGKTHKNTDLYQETVNSGRGEGWEGA